MKWWLSVVGVLYVLDQTTKALVLRHISTEDNIPVIPNILNLVQVHNTGAAFGMMHNSSWFFVLLASTALIVLVILARRGKFPDRLSRWAAALLMAGVAGNLTDRLTHGFVVDFLDVILPIYGHWPAFNVADSCICIAAGLFVIGSFRTHRPKEA